MKKLAEFLAYVNGILIVARLLIAALRALKLDPRLVARLEAALNWLDIFVARILWPPAWAR